MTTYLVPVETAWLLNQHKDRCKNLKLWLARYVPDEVIQKLPYGERGRQNWRDMWLKDLPTSVDVKLVKATHDRWQALTQQAITFDAHLQGPLLIGHGAKGVLEFGLTLSHVTGLPLIPGSALKGMARTYGLFVIAANLSIPTIDQVQLNALETILETLDWSAEDNQSFNDALTVLAEQYSTTIDKIFEVISVHPLVEVWRWIFGTQEQAGACVFYDAVVKPPPAPTPLFKVDVLTPHFKDYYDEANKENPNFARMPAPHDGQDPNPVLFLAVAAKTCFSFAVGLRHTYASVADEENAVAIAAIHAQAVDWLQRGLFELGVGAKTAAGYGVFINFDPDLQQKQE